jgi:hypothetical protein
MEPAQSAQRTVHRLLIAVSPQSDRFQCLEKIMWQRHLAAEQVERDLRARFQGLEKWMT